MTKKVLYSALQNSFYPFHHQAFNLETAFLPEHLEEPDSLLVLWGGEDISPSIYGEKPNKHTYAREVPGKRDEMEIALAKRAIEMGIPIIGICRGAQLMCALSGGKLIQHVTNHSNGAHMITTKDGEQLKTSSLHHQMMFPFGIKHEMIATSTRNLSDIYLGEDNRSIGIDVEPEIVFFPQTKTLGIQGHPEYMDEHSKFVLYCNQLVEEYLLK